MPDLNREINEYVAYITPEIDVNQWKAVSSKIEGVLGSGLNAVTGLFNKKLQKAREELDKLQKEQASAKAKLLEITQIRQQKEDVSTQLSRIRSIDVSTEKGKEKYRELGGEKEEDRLSKLLSKLTGKYEQLGGKDKELELSEKTAKGAKAMEVLSNTINGLSTKNAALAKGVAVAAGTLALFVTAVIAAYKAANKFADAAVDISNKFVSGSTIRPDTDVRDVMIRYGVDTNRAQAMTATSETLGLDLDDYSKWTSGARKAFKELTNYYEDEINKIDPDKLKRFNEATQEYQLLQAKFQIKLRTSLIKLVSESDVLPKLLDTLSDSMELLTDILSSPAVQVGVETILELINAILSFVNQLGKGINWLLGGSSSNNTTNTTNTTNKNTTITINASSSDTTQLARQIGAQLQSSLG